MSKILIHLFLLLLLIIPNRASAQTNNVKVIDQIVAVVGDNIITESEIEAQYAQYLSQGNAIDPSQSPKMKCQILNDMLFQKLLLNQAKNDSLVVSEGQVTTELDKRIKYFINQIGSQEKLEEYYKKSIIEIKSEFKELISNQLLTQQMQAKITTGVNVTPSDVREYFEKIPKDSIPLINAEVEIGQIVRKPKLSEAEKKEVYDKLNVFRERMLKGENFAALATLYSEDIMSAKKGGELGFVGRGDLVPEFESVAFSLKPEEISKIIETQYGYHIIQLIERRGEQINVRHILLKPKFSSESLQKANLFLDSIHDLLDKGTVNFAQAALLYSDDAETKNNGGIIVNTQTGTTKYEPSQLEPTLFFHIDKLKVNEYSKPVLIPLADGSQAYHILYLKSRTEPHKANLKDDYQKIQSSALSEKQNSIVKKWIREKQLTTAINIKKEYISDSLQCTDVIKNWLKP